jgi:putative nucleotidyltransferase with HDIG domain
MTVEQIINDIDHLEPIPAVANQILELTQNPDVNIGDVAALITHDAAITANILKTVNSAYFGLKRKIESVQDAVVMLGLNPIVELVFMQTSASNLKKAYVGYDLEEGDLWRHSAVSAILARMIAQKQEMQNVNRVFTAALLKDIGKVVLNQYVRDGFKDIQYLVHEQHYSFKAAEEEVIGIGHDELGGIVAEKWNFSNQLAYIIRHHHLTDPKADKDLETCVVYLADVICSSMGIGAGSDGLAYHFIQAVMERLGYDQNGIEALILAYAIKKKEIDALIDAY